MILPLVYSSGIAVGFLLCVNIGLDFRQRDHPTVLKARTRRLIAFNALCLLFVYFVCDRIFYGDLSIAQITGFRIESVTASTALPLLLTVIFYAGPLVTHFVVDGCYVLLLERAYWIESLTNPLSLRDHVWAPIFEEISFRSCVLPLLYPVFGELRSAIIGPLLFGLCHFHHIFERANRLSLKKALLVTSTQCVITTMFGMYSSYIFLRTANILPCILVHSFCNFMGVPTLPEGNRWLWAIQLGGIAAWLYLLSPILGDQSMYGNSIFV